MLKTIKARCVNGALVPLEPVELREGDEYLITLTLDLRCPSRKGSGCCVPLPARGGNTTSIGKKRNGCFTRLAG